jgi:hypothetical protein
MKLAEFVENMGEEELYRLQYDISNGSTALKGLIEEKIKKVEHLPKKHCAVCGDELVDKEGTFSIIFKHDKLKKKASFCAVDCMEFFITKIKKAHGLRDNVPEQKIENQRFEDRKQQ